MKVTVKDYLNVRVGKPSVNAPTYQYLAPGSKIEVDNDFYPGDTYDGINKWLRDQTGNYYWSGGFKLDKVDNTEFSSYWFEALELVTLRKIEQGKNSTVLVLDSGINKNLEVFKGRPIVYENNFVKGSKTIESIDVDSHGTHCAALIGGKESKDFLSVAPESQLIIGKITENGQLDDSTTLQEALDYFVDEKYKIDVISISQTIVNDVPKVKMSINEHIKRGRIVVAAIGNDTQNRNLNKKRYPGFYEECISVGSCEVNNSLSKYTCYPDRASIFCYGTDIKSFKRDSYPEPLTGTSQATAIVAGIVALIVSFCKGNSIKYTSSQIKELLEKYSTPLSDHSNYKLIRPLLIFEKLKSLKNGSTLQNILAHHSHE